MTKMKFRFFVLGVICALLALVRQTAPAQTYQGRELVKAELIADTTAVVPGKPFTVGLLLHMARVGTPIGNIPATPGCRRKSNGSCRRDGKSVKSNGRFR